MSKASKVYNSVTPMALGAIVIMNLVLVWLNLEGINNQSMLLKQIDNATDQNEEILRHVQNNTEIALENQKIALSNQQIALNTSQVNQGIARTNQELLTNITMLTQTLNATN